MQDLEPKDYVFTSLAIYIRTEFPVAIFMEPWMYRLHFSHKSKLATDFERKKDQSYFVHTVCSARAGDHGHR